MKKLFFFFFKIFVFIKIVVNDKIKDDYNLLFLVCGVFFSVLVIGYVSMGF